MGQKACAVAGHDPKRFKFKYKEDYSLCKKIKREIREQIQKFYDEEGVRRFYIGGSLGVDIWAGEMILRLKEQPGYEEIELVMVLPYPEHGKNWDELSKKRLDFLQKHSATCMTIGERNGWESYERRNRYLVDQADYLLAVYDDAADARLQITQMVEYAKKKRKKVVLIHPDTACIIQR